ncbi:MAG TPA: serine/threonine-protein kinase [Planctomycetota bacterium]|nr:serine/threonine-protein kinase [Planctomycetota bacterium]
MLTATDIMAAKIVVQLNLAPVDDVRAELRASDKEPGRGRDVVNRLADRGKLGPKDVELVRHRVALYEHVRSEASYVRSLERMGKVPKLQIAEMIARLEQTAFRKRLGDVLVKEGRITAEQDALLANAEKDVKEKDDARVLDKYRKEDFAGVARDLIPKSRLEPQDFKISTLFRGKETRALVDKAELKAALEAASSDRVKAAEPPPAAAPATFLSSEDRVRSMKRIADYSIVEVLGVGGMGAVFLAQREGTGEYVAIKVLLNEKATTAEKARFGREVELTPLVKHPNVIPLLDAGKTSDGMAYLVVPALAGKEMRNFLKASPGGLAPQLVIRIFSQILGGLQAVHDAGILHRDLKPENIFVLAGGQHDLRIMDFGLAKRIHEKDLEAFRTMAGEIVGSPAYIAPETVQSDFVDGRTDLYSLGVMLFEALTGKLPIESQTTMGYLTAHMVAPPLTLAEAAPERTWAPELESFLARLLGKFKDERPASAAAALEELRALEPKILAAGSPAGAAPEVTDSKRFVSKTLLGRLERSSSD